jgi:sugar phosphate isomerase/epimerase
MPHVPLGVSEKFRGKSKRGLYGDAIEELDPSKIFLVQLSDFMWQETRTFEERITTARTYRVFPGEGVHTPQVAEMVLKLDALGYQGDYSFEVFNDDYVQMPLPMVCERAQRSALWLAEDVMRRGAPLPGQMRLRPPGTDSPAAPAQVAGL